jgi:hypothetical protein
MLGLGPLGVTHSDRQTPRKNQRYAPGMYCESLTSQQTENLMKKSNSQPFGGQLASRLNPGTGVADSDTIKKVKHDISKSWKVRQSIITL